MMNLHVLKKIQVSHGIFYGILLKGVTLNFLEHVYAHGLEEYMYQQRKIKSQVGYLRHKV